MFPPRSFSLLASRSSRLHLFPLLGRFGDTVAFSALPTDVQTAKMAAHFGATNSAHAADDELSVACGSPFEVMNDPTLGNHYPFMVEDRSKQLSSQDFGKSTMQHEEELDFPVRALLPRLAHRTGTVVQDVCDFVRSLAEMCAPSLPFPSNQVHSDKTKAMAWTNHVLKAPDQLRQRMAWALQQTVVVANAGLSRKKEHEVRVGFVACIYLRFVHP